MHELRRRGIWRVAIGYLAASWLLIQILETVLPVFDLPETSIRWVIIVLTVGMLPALALAWVFEWTPEGLRQDAEVDHEAADVRAASRLLDRLGYWRFVSLLCGINRCENPKINRLSATLGVSRFRWIP